MRVKNQCSKDLDVAIRYKNISGNWIFAKWYRLDSGERSFLKHDNSRMKTKSAVIYSYAKTISGTPWDTGPYEFASGGRVYEMKKTVDKEGVTDIVLCD